MSNTTGREPQSIEVLDLWRHFTDRYRSRVIDKHRAWEMRAVAWFLERLGVLDAPTFMNRFTTTIGRRVYVPFDVGVPSDRHSLWGQVVTCTHEHQHIAQLEREGSLAFSSRYLTSSAARAMYEAEAYRCNLELHFWRTGELLSPADLAGKLRHYGCDSDDIAVAEESLRLASETVRLGGVSTEAGQRAIAWLNRFAPDWRVG